MKFMRWLKFKESRTGKQRSEVYGLWRDPVNNMKTLLTPVTLKFHTRLFLLIALYINQHLSHVFFMFCTQVKWVLYWDVYVQNTILPKPYFLSFLGLRFIWFELFKNSSLSENLFLQFIH